MWKLLIDSKDLIAYECLVEDLKIRIEARSSDNIWEVYKTYHSNSGEVNFTEEYEASTRNKATDIISKIKKEILDESEIKRIEKLKKNINIKVRRSYNEKNVEKWTFAVSSEDYSNSIIIRYGSELEIDLIVDEAYKYIESELLDEITLVLGLNEYRKDLIQNIYFFSKKSGFYTCDESSEDKKADIEVGLEFMDSKE